MQFKWVRSSLSLWVNLFSSFGFSVLAWPIADAGAYIFVQPANGGSASPQVNSQFVQNFTFNYFVQASGVPAIPTYANNSAFINFTPLDPTATPPGPQQVDSNMFQVTISTSAPVTNTGGQVPVITFYAYPNSGNAHLAPIAAVNGIPCGLGNSGCIAQNANTGIDSALNPYYAAIYPGNGQSITIGFYPNQLCKDANNQQVTLTGCNTTTPSIITTPTGGTPVSLQLVFQFGYSPDGRTIPAAASQGSIDTLTTPITFTFQTDIPSFNCPSPVASAYLQPGDSQIFLNTSLFAQSLPSTVDANPANVTIVGQDTSMTQSSPVVDETFNSPGVNTLVSQVGFSPSTPVPGFTNSTLAQEHIYNISFIAQDYAGIYVAPPPGTCILNDVQTADIEGFLAKGNCFIATAAFRSLDAEPILLLRKFRNHFLLSSKSGKKLVSIYNRWSPPAAHWLMRHPIFRYPVLLALAPVELMAWFCFHPLLFLALSIIIGMCSILLFRQRSLQSTKGL